AARKACQLRCRRGPVGRHGAIPCRRSGRNHGTRLAANGNRCPRVHPWRHARPAARGGPLGPVVAATSLGGKRLGEAAPMTALVKNRAAVLWAAAILLCLGFGTWQLGQAAYIKAKAELAQVLLERAWSKTLQDGKPHKAWAWADMWPIAKIEFP